MSAKKTSVGAIAGGIVGGVLGAVLIAAAIFFCIRRRKNANDGSGEPLEKVDLAYVPVQAPADPSSSQDDLRARFISPFQGGHPSADPSMHPKAYAALMSGDSPYSSNLYVSPHVTSDARPSESASGSDYFSQRLSPAPAPGSSSGGGSVVSDGIFTQTKAMFTRPRPASPDIVQERDGGAMPQVFVPPVYDPSWAQSSGSSSRETTQ
jgi:hypothetical protein